MKHMARFIAGSYLAWALLVFSVSALAADNKNVAQFWDKDHLQKYWDDLALDLLQKKAPERMDEPTICMADVNYDGVVNFMDLIIVRDEFLRDDCETRCPAGADNGLVVCLSDANEDNVVNFDDISFFTDEFLRIDCPITTCAAVKVIVEP